jgi:hypothetical protein
MLLFCDSFGHYTSLSQKWNGVIGGCSVSNTGRIGSTSMLIVPAFTPAYVTKTVNVTTANGGGYVGFALNSTLPTSGPMNFFGVLGGFSSGNTIQLAFNTAMQISIVVNGITLATSSLSVLANVWQYIEVFTVIGDGGAPYPYGHMEVRVNGVAFVSATGANVPGISIGSSGLYNGVQLGWLPGSAAYTTTCSICDVYMSDGSGSFNNTFLGDVSVLMRLPSANGSQNDYTNAWASWAASTVMAVGNQIKDSNGNIQRVTAITGDAKTGGSAPTWATAGGSPTTDNHVTFAVVGAGANPGAHNWMAVCENPPDDNGSYVTDATVNDQDRYTYPVITGSQVFAVSVSMRAGKDDSGTRSVRGVTKSGGTTADSGTDFPLSFGYADLQGIFETDPHTSSPWTVAAVNAAEFGVKTTA